MAKKPLSDDQPNLDLIGMVQQARLAHDAQAQPSQISAIYWIEAKPQNPMREPTARAGHWLIRTTVQTVDTVWANIRDATIAGKLGYKSKVATIGLTKPDERILHVMTYDADDAADVERVRVALRDLGFDNLTYEHPM
ncbi:MAG TPA: putative phosphothreonine lyase domain-containing protein [Phototrophicaceae bacterium]|nr:putative phosphothreonine lyase domain-containing protein [Phototrophicaceae bacterium]